MFGSVARGDNRVDSDIDILVEFDPAAHVTVFDYVGVKDFIAGLFREPVDVIDREALKPHLRGPSNYATRSMRSEGDCRARSPTLYNMELADQFTRGMTFEEFRDDLMRVYAAVRCLEIISERRAVCQTR